MPPKVDNSASGSDSAGVENPNEAIGRVMFKIPPFWRTNPGLWFAQVEAQFATSNITNEITKFNAIVAAIESSVLSQVSDIILGPAENKTYDQLKARLITAFADSEQQRLRKLLSELKLDDKKPSQLLREMRELAGQAVPEDLLRTLWIQRLASPTKAILAANDGNLQALATLADKIQEVTATPATVAEVDTSSTSTYGRLERQIAALSKQVSSLLNNRGRTPVRERSKSRGRSSSRSEQGACFYHRRFGDAANKCRQPCSYKKAENTNANH